MLGPVNLTSWDTFCENVRAKTFVFLKGKYKWKIFRIDNKKKIESFVDAFPSSPLEISPQTFYELFALSTNFLYPQILSKTFLQTSLKSSISILCGSLSFVFILSRLIMSKDAANFHLWRLQVMENFYSIKKSALQFFLRVSLKFN